MRIFVASLFHEGNSFSTLTTRAENFAVARGEALLAKAATSTAALGGACRMLARRGADILPGVSAVTPPGGPVEDGFYRALRDEMLTLVRKTQPDGIYLDLHGAMITETLDDPEGDLLAHLRAALGATVPIAVSLDLHAHVTEAMLAAADIIVACKENPHTDYDLAGARAAELLMDRLHGSLAPVTAAVWVPFIFGAQMETGTGPLAEIHRRRRKILAYTPSLRDISIYNCTTLVDVHRGWQCITALADADPAVAQAAVTVLAEEFWAMRAAFTPEFPPLDAVLGAVAARRLPLPVILGDQGDRVLAGAPGDGTQIMTALAARWPQLRAVVPVTDPVAVRLAQAAGVGGAFTAPVGGGMSRGLVPFDGTWQVRHLSDGAFVQAGPFLKDEQSSLGDTAVLQSGHLTVLATSLPGFTQDPEAFRSQGIDLAAMDVIVAKSGYHFKISFAGIGTCVAVDTPGISNYRPGMLPFAKRRPVFPEDAVDSFDATPRLYPAGRRGAMQR